MSTIVINNVPIAPKYRVGITADLDGTGHYQMVLLDIAATCTMTVDEGAPMSTFFAGMSEEEIKAHDIFKMTAGLFGNGIQAAIMDRNPGNYPTKAAFGTEVAVWEKLSAEKANADFSAQYKCTISDVRFDTVACYNKEETEILYEWKATQTAQAAPAASGAWTCAYCGGSMTGNFCCNCGAPRP